MKLLGQTKRRSRLGLALLGLTVIVGMSGRARAGPVLEIGSTYPAGFNFTLFGNYVNEPGGNITPSFLDGQPLNYVYCVAANVDIYVPDSYDVSLSTAGIYNGSLLNGAGQISWLMTHLASSAVTQDEQSGLQAAIWQQLYGSNFVLDQVHNDPALVAAFNADIAALGTNSAPLSNLIWITPYNGDGSVAQGLVALNSVPEPSSLALAGFGVLGAFALARRIKRH